MQSPLLADVKAFAMQSPLLADANVTNDHCCGQGTIVL